MSLVPAITEGRRLLPIVCALFCVAGLSIAVVSEGVPPSGIPIVGKHHPHERKGLLKNLPKLLRNRNLTVFLATLFLYRLCESTANGFLSLYLKELHASSSLIAMAWASAAVVEIPFMLWVGGASDRMGRRPPMVIAFLALPIRLFLYAHLRTPTDIFYAQLLQGFTFSFMLVPSVAFMADVSSGELRATGQGLLSMTSGVAMALGPFLGGWMADKLSMGTMYLSIAGAALLAGLIFILLVHESQPDLTPDRLKSRAARWHPILRPAVRILSKPVLGLIRD
jgi:MFS family permease